MELSSPMLNPSVPPQQIPPDELWFGPSPGEFDKTPLTMEGRTVGRSPVRRPGGGGCRRRTRLCVGGRGGHSDRGSALPLSDARRLGRAGVWAAGHCPAAIGRAPTWYAYATLNNDTTTAEIVALSGDGSPDSLLPWDQTAGRRDGHEDHSDRSNS